MENQDKNQPNQQNQTGQPVQSNHQPDRAKLMHEERQILEKERKLVSAELVAEEEKLLKKANADEKGGSGPLGRLKEHPWVTWPAVGVVAAGIVFGALYLYLGSRQVYIENSTIEAPTIALGPTAAGILQEIDVQVGDTVAANQTVARVGNELIQTTIAGEVIAVDNTIGTLVTPGTAVVTMIDPTQLRVVGQIEEDKGLSAIRIGQSVNFTADAFGSQKFAGVVDEIDPTADASDVVFNISDEREEQNFNVKVRYNTDEYPQLLNGMSARIWVYK